MINPAILRLQGAYVAAIRELKALGRDTSVHEEEYRRSLEQINCVDDGVHHPGKLEDEDYDTVQRGFETVKARA